MSGYCARIRSFAEEMCAIGKDHGWKEALHAFLQRSLRIGETLLYEQSLAVEPLDIPEAIHIVVVSQRQRSIHQADIEKAGGKSDLGNFESGGDCYLLTFEGQPAGVTWMWTWETSRLLRRLGYPRNTVYLGGDFVRPEFRSRGLHTINRRFQCAQAARLFPGGKAVVEVDEDNAASRRSLEKAGFSWRWRMRYVIIAGIMVWVRLRPAADI